MSLGTGVLGEVIPSIAFPQGPCHSDSVVTPEYSLAYQQNAPLVSLCCLLFLENKALSNPSNRWEMFGTVMSPSVGN